MSSQAERAAAYVDEFKRETTYGESCLWRIQRVSGESLPVLGLAFLVAAKRIDLSAFAVLEKLGGKWSRELVVELAARGPDFMIIPRRKP